MLKRKKWLAFLLVVCMLLTAMPVSAFADTGSGAERTLVCGLEESAGHAHDESCVCPGGELICGLEEGGHVHNDACYTEEQQLICTSEEDGHEHAVECYTTEKVLNCGLEETEHVHSDACYCQGGEYICGLEESEGHIHTEECYESEEVEESETPQEQDEPENTINLLNAPSRTVYRVSSADEFNRAIEYITNSEEAEAIIEISQDISDVSFVGVKGKKVTLKSTEDKQFEFLSVGSSLVGDITLDNVSAKLALKMYANGHTFETTERFSISKKTISYYRVEGRIDYLFGGGYTDADVNGDTNLIIRGDFQSEWIFGGGYNSDVSGDTNILINGSDVWVGNLYGGGHFGDNTNSGKYDPTDTARILGNTNVTVTAGTFGSLFGGGYNQRCDMQYVSNAEVFRDARVTLGQKGADDYTVKAGYSTASHGGSFFSEVGNVRVTIYSGVNFNARGDNDANMYGAGISDIVNGTIEIIVDAKSGKGTLIDRIYGTGDYHPSYNEYAQKSRVLNCNNKDNAIAITYDNIYQDAIEGIITGRSEGNVDEDYAGKDIIHGNVFLNILRGDMNFVILDSGDDKGTILGNATAWIGDSNIGYVQGNAALYADADGQYESNVHIQNAKDTVYGYFYKIHNLNVKDGSDILIDSDKLGIFSSTQKPFYSVNNMNITGRSTVTTRNSNTILEGYVTMSENSTWNSNGKVYIYGDMTSQESTWHAYAYAYVYETMISQRSHLYFDDYFAIGYNHKSDIDMTALTVFNSTEDEFVALKTNYVDKFYGNVELHNSDVAFLSLVEVKGNWSGGDSLLRLPVADPYNYPTVYIPLRIDGVASQQCEVLTVSPTDQKIAVKPAVGQNYIIGYAPDGTTSGDKPIQATFVLKNSDAVADGLYLKRVQDANIDYKDQNFMWQVAKDERIIITPTSVTLYTGGKGYGGVVINDNGEMTTDAENGIPEPGFLLTLPDALKNIDVENDLTLQYNDDNNTYTWGFEKYGEGNHSVYRIKPIGTTEKRPVRIELTHKVDGKDVVVDSDSFIIDDYLNQELSMTIYGDSIDKGLVSFVHNNTKYDFTVGEAQLTVRVTTGEESYGMLTGEIEKDEPHITAEEGTHFTINNSNVQVDDASGIALLFDDIIEKNTEGKNNTQLLKERTDKELENSDILSGEGTRSYDMKYLDLVDTNNGNVWVKAVDENGNGRDITVYWPLPDGTDKNTEFELLHFEGLHREMGTNVIADLIEECTVESMDIKEVTDTHVVFNVGSGGFSPFVLVWEKTDSGSSGGGGGGSSTKYYTLHYESNGGTEYDDERYKKNTVVDLDKVPVRMGYTFTGWYADEELTVKITDIKMTSDKTVYAGWVKSTVPDQLNGDDHFAYVVGYPDGSVQPNGNITRAEVAAIFFRLLQPEVRDSNLSDTNVFTDVTENDWHNVSVSTMAELNIIKGRTETTFVPDAPITRAEFAAICARFDTGLTEGDSNLTDISGHWAEEEIERAVSLGWIAGYPDGTFKPNQFITRAEAVSIINRVLCRMPEEPEDLLSGMNIWPDNMDTNKWYYLAVQEATNSHTYEHKGEIHETWLELTADPDWSRYNNI